MYNAISKLIVKRFYSTRELAESKIDICFAMSTITQEQYVDLMMLLDEYYPIPVEEEVETEV